MKVLHITSHTGGGIGKALSGLCKQAKIAHSENEHIIVCLEEPKDKQFFNKLVENGTSVIVQPEYNELENLMESSDIVQVEFWNHPLLLKYLCEMNIPDIKLVTWCHINGLFNPIIPEKLIKESHRFIFTSPCSSDKYSGENISCVHSSGGFDDFPKINRTKDNELKVGYFGSTNFSKMHPKYSDFINSIDISDLKVKIIGDLHNKDILETESDKFEFTGFVSDVSEELKKINVLAYILNPEHYGTTENALLEAMSMGIVPIVLDNSCERKIVIDGYNGFIIRKSFYDEITLQSFIEKIEFLYNHPEVRKEMGINASNSIRKHFSAETSELVLNNICNNVIMIDKKKINFKSIFGNTPSEWFLSCQGNKEIFKDNGTIDLSTVSKYGKYILFEESKGSVHHFSKYFSEDKLLKSWSDNMRLLQ